jgi:uncharacterized membrane protein YfcA
MEPLVPFILLVILIAGFVHGYGGFGFGILSMSVFSLLPVDIERMSVVITLNVLVIPPLVFVLSRSRGHVRWADIGLLFLGAMCGQPVGYWFIATFGDRAIFRVVLGAVLLVAAANGFRSSFRPRRFPLWSAPLFGTVSGFLAGAFVSGGPPVVLFLYSRTRDPRDMKATIQALFVMMTIFRMSIIGVAGRGYTQDVLLLSAISIPLVIPFVALGHRFSDRGNVLAFRRGVYCLIGAFGVMGLTKGALLCLP